MDFEDSFASAPVRYALDDIDSDEELEACVNNQKVSVQAKITVDSDNCQSNLTLVFGLDGPGNVYIHSLEGKPAVIGTVTRFVDDKNAEVKASILQLSDKKTLFIPFDGAIQPEEAGQYTKAILNGFAGKIEKVVVLDSFTAVGYTSEVWGDDLTPPFLRVLQTSASPTIKGLTLYESPNMIKGLAASIVNHCEIHSIPCYDLLTLQESIYGKLLITVEILQAYDEGLKQLGLKIHFNEKLMNETLASRHSGRVDDNHHRLYL
ncbi:hypothetical protein INT47_002182 [Mucor saturninus]|uniref:Proteasome assembly chaperone 1 n=1 Tax=Mucor saturninus TaxID=64648 RepID=A0A8H7V6F1_9FUNG|nr:hypothetical protein INT47_002182 [Mucor saturninus]